MPRQPNRTPKEKLEDSFFDLSVPEQEAMLATFQTLHRMKIRTTSEQPKLLVQPTAGKADAVNERGKSPCSCCKSVGSHLFDCPLESPQGSLIDGPTTESEAQS